jgi:capsular polysaccharide transport system ATP-binding protein
VIQIENLSKVYRTRQGRHVVLDKVNLRIERGEKVGILGRNGAGKSTLIRLISGAEFPTSGRIRRRMSVSFPLAFGGAFQPNLTGLDNLRFICRIYGVEYAKVIPFVEDFTELGVFLREPVHHYSSGMSARLAFALSLAIEFDCFLIDEVIAVGDARFHEKCNIELFEKRKDRALILVSHNIDLIRAHCRRTALLSEGKLQSFDSVDEAYAQYQASTH